MSSWHRVLFGNAGNNINHGLIQKGCVLIHLVGIAFADNIECVPGKTIRQLVIAGLSTTAVRHTQSVGLIDCNAREGVGTGDREYPGAARPSEWSDAGRQRHE